jgi:hydrogenase/urease accessory protein HupE
MLNRLFLVLVFVALPATVLAHPGPHSHPHAEGTLHPLLTLDHVLPLLGIALAALMAYRWYRSRS